MQSFQPLFSFAIVPWVVYGMALGVGVEGFQPNVNPAFFACRLMLAPPISLDTKLYVVAIGTMHNAYSLDLLGGEGCNLLLRIANQAQSPDATAISERDVLPIRSQFPAALLVFH